MEEMQDKGMGKGAELPFPPRHPTLPNLHMFTNSEVLPNLSLLSFYRGFITQT